MRSKAQFQSQIPMGNRQWAWRYDLPSCETVERGGAWGSCTCVSYLKALWSIKNKPEQTINTPKGRKGTVSGPLLCLLVHHLALLFPLTTLQLHGDVKFLPASKFKNRPFPLLKCFPPSIYLINYFLSYKQ